MLALLKSRAIADHDEAMKYASTAVETASGVGLLQTVASEGSESVETRRAHRMAGPGGMARPPPAMHSGGVGRRGRPPTPQVEPLTERERDVLRFCRAG